MAKQTGQQSVICYHCGRPFDTGEHTQSTSCPRCHKRVVIEDVTVATLKSVTRIQTCGHVVILPAGRVIAKLVQGQKGVDVQGTVEASVVSAGVVSIGPKARWKGDCQARGLSVKSGAKVFGLFAIAGAAGLTDDHAEAEEAARADADAAAQAERIETEHEATPLIELADAAPPEGDKPPTGDGRAATPAPPAAPPMPGPKPPPRYDLIRHGGRS